MYIIIQARPVSSPWGFNQHTTTTTMSNLVYLVIIAFFALFAFGRPAPPALADRIASPQFNITRAHIEDRNLDPRASGGLVAGVVLVTIVLILVLTAMYHRSRKRRDTPSTPGGPSITFVGLIGQPPRSYNRRGLLRGRMPSTDTRNTSLARPGSAAPPAYTAAAPSVSSPTHGGVRFPAPGS